MKSSQLQFITDHKGKKLSVVLPIKEYKTILENLEELKNTRRIKDKEPTNKEILTAITQGMKEAELHKQGKLKLKSAKELLNEL
ncbi:hypothetical protein [Leptospira kirschneri]|uniref:hypothetical protein n=1 Tax=Leptospira kirschneri TaxID=29507 RepID=UPI0009E1A273|nr:hypothetical protein [Leptospira kirschneri]